MAEKQGRQAAGGKRAGRTWKGVVEDEPGIKSMMHKTTRSWNRSGNNEKAETLASWKTTKRNGV